MVSMNLVASSLALISPNCNSWILSMQSFAASQASAMLFVSADTQRSGGQGKGLGVERMIAVAALKTPRCSINLRIGCTSNWSKEKKAAADASVKTV
jgi:hypothetical protein